MKVEAPDRAGDAGREDHRHIKAKYYFGAPVTEAKVKYKVLRYDYSANWYPIGIWDWFYEPGYWWFAYDYHWYPGWRDWGCWRPHSLVVAGGSRSRRKSSPRPRRPSARTAR